MALNSAVLRHIDIGNKLNDNEDLNSTLLNIRMDRKQQYPFSKQNLKTVEVGLVTRYYHSFSTADKEYSPLDPFAKFLRAQ